MKSLYWNLLGFVLVFLYCANIHFIFLPDLVRTKLIIGVLGVLYASFSLSKAFRLNKPLLMALIPLMIWMTFSILYNDSEDWWFIRFSLVQIVYIFGAWLVVDLCGINSVQKIAKLLAVYVIVQNSIAFLGLQIPFFRTIVETTTYENSFDSQMGQLAYRGLGLGDHVFFGGGVWTCIGLLMIVYLYKIRELSGWVFAALFIYVLFTGLFVARTAAAGLVTLLLLFTPLKKNWYKVIAVALGVMILFSIMGMVESWMLEKGYKIGNAFELYNNYIKTGELTTTSSDSTERMWSIIPETFKTWFLGDARYTDNIMGGYYMHTDVGYLRVIWYGGVVGLYLYLYQIFRFCHLTYKRSRFTPELRNMLSIYFLLVLMWLWKGHSDTSCVLYLLFCTSCVCVKKRRLKQSNDNHNLSMDFNGLYRKWSWNC